MPPAVPPAFIDRPQGMIDALKSAALTGGVRTGSPAAHGWCAVGRASARASSHCPGLSVVSLRGARPDRRCVLFDWRAVYGAQSTGESEGIRAARRAGVLNQIQKSPDTLIRATIVQTAACGLKFSDSTPASSVEIEMIKVTNP